MENQIEEEQQQQLSERQEQVEECEKDEGDQLLEQKEQLEEYSDEEHQQQHDADNEKKDEEHRFQTSRQLPEHPEQQDQDKKKEAMKAHQLEQISKHSQQAEQQFNKMQQLPEPPIQQDQDQKEEAIKAHQLEQSSMHSQLAEQQFNKPQQPPEQQHQTNQLEEIQTIQEYFEPFPNYQRRLSATSIQSDASSIISFARPPSIISLPPHLHQPQQFQYQQKQFQVPLQQQTGGPPLCFIPSSQPPDHRFARPLRRNSSQIVSNNFPTQIMPPPPPPRGNQYIQRYYVPQNVVAFPQGSSPGYSNGIPQNFQRQPSLSYPHLVPSQRPLRQSIVVNPHQTARYLPPPNPLRNSIISQNVSSQATHAQFQHPQQLQKPNMIIRPNTGIHRPLHSSSPNLIVRPPSVTVPLYSTIPVSNQTITHIPANTIYTHIQNGAPLARPMFRPPIIFRPRKPSLSMTMSMPIRFSSFQRIDSAFLSKVAKYFKDHVVLNTEVIESIEYRDCFSGKHAVDILSELVTRKDRNIALILGRSLESQFFFHDINWHNRLLDTKDKIYEFDSSTLFKHDDHQINLPTSIFTPLTKCYSPTCSGKGCYSSSCPFKLDEIALLKSQSLLLIQNTSDVLEDVIQDESSSAYWSSYAPKEIVESLSKDELTKQEVIYELIQSEKNYVYGLEIVFESFRDVIRKTSVVHPSKREEFLSSLFINRQALLAAHRKLLQRLIHRQKESYIFTDIASIFLSQISDFENYIEYGKHEPYARWIFTEEKENNRTFSDFLSEFQRDPRNRRAEFDHYLRLPSTRFAGYRLQIDRIIKYTPQDHQEYPSLQKVAHALTEIGKRSNIEGGKTVDHIKILQFRKSTELTNAEAKMLNLSKFGRQIIRSGSVMIKRGSVTTDLSVDYTLFDHVLIFLSKKKAERRKIYKKIYPLQLVKLKGEDLISSMQNLSTQDTASNDSSSDDNVSISGASPKLATTKPASILSTSSATNTKEGKFTVDLEILGSEKVMYRLVFKTDAEKVSWQKAILSQKETLEHENAVFKVASVGNIHTEFRIYSSSVYEEMIFMGHDRGVLVATQTQTETTIRHILDLSKVTHIHALSSAKCLLVLSDRTLYSFDIDVVLSEESNSQKMSHAEKISTGVAFFEVGIVFDKAILCSVKNGSMDSRIKLYEPRDTKVEKKRGFGSVFKNISYSSWNYFEELYVPSIAFALQFLKNRLCIACTKGYEIVDLNSLQSQSLLDMSDERLKSITARDNCRSMSLFKVSEGKFLLCYNVFGFFVDQYGRCSSSEYLTWQGEPYKFVYQSPYLVCFTQSFIEIHDVHRCELKQIIPGEEMLMTNGALKHFISADGNDKFYLYELISGF